MQPSTTWEMDFFSRPLLDKRGKRVWELLVCDRHGVYKRQSYCANTQATTPWVAAQLEQWIEEAPVKPTVIRAYRERMKTILQRSCDKVEVPLRMTRRVFALADWMQQRAREIYPNEGDYSYEPESLTIQIETERDAPQRLPDALVADSWAMVTLRVQDIREARDWPKEFGELFGMDWDRLDPDVLVPGLLLVSNRARPMAAWMTGVEPVFLKAFGGEQGGLVLEAGSNDRYVLARFHNEGMRNEGNQFEGRKLDVRGLHFLGIQSDPDDRKFAGFWMLREVDLP